MSDRFYRGLAVRAVALVSMSYVIGNYDVLRRGTHLFSLVLGLAAMLMVVAVCLTRPEK